MSECTNGEMRDLLPELVSGRLGAEMQLAVEAHVAECGECTEELALLRSLRPVLMGGPVVDTARIAAAVRAQVPAARAREATRRAAPWRIALAAAALLAVSAIGYAVVIRSRGAVPEFAGLPAPVAGTRDSADSAKAPAHGAPPSAPSPRRDAAPTRPRQLAVAPSHAPDTAIAYASAGVLDNLTGLSDDDVRTLTASLDGISSVPDADPAPDIDPLGATLDDQAAGGS